MPRYLNSYMQHLVSETREQRARRLEREASAAGETADAIVDNLVLRNVMAEVKSILEKNDIPAELELLTNGYLKEVLLDRRRITSPYDWRIDVTWKFSEPHNSIIRADCLKFYKDVRDLIDLMPSRYRNELGMIGRWFCITRNFGGDPFTRMGDEYIQVGDQLHRACLMYLPQQFAYRAPNVRIVSTGTRS